MSSDKRVLIIGLVVMVALVGVGVVSGSLFAASACDDIGPSPIAGPVASTEPGPALASADATTHETALAELVEELTEPLGTLSGVADANGATGLTPLTDGIAATGSTTVSLDATGSEVVAAAGFSGPAQIVGSGDRLYSLALTNQLTGQVDALQPQDVELEPGTCIDTAVVGDPFAFYLDAAGGELLLIRIEEDGDAPQLELRDAFQGRRWFAELEAPVAPPGILAERITGGLSDDLVVAARRTVPGEDEAAVVAVGRDRGERHWEVAADHLLAEVADVLGEEDPIWLDVVAIDGEVAVVSAAGEQARDHVVLLVVDVETGTIRSVIAPEGGTVQLLDLALGAQELEVAWSDPGAADEIVVARYGLADGAPESTDRRRGDRAVVASGWVATPSALLRSTENGFDQAAQLPEEIEVVDLLEVGAATSLLVDLDDEATVVVTFTGGG